MAFVFPGGHCRHGAHTLCSQQCIQVGHKLLKRHRQNGYDLVKSALGTKMYGLVIGRK